MTFQYNLKNKMSFHFDIEIADDVIDTVYEPVFSLSTIAIAPSGLIFKLDTRVLA